MTNKKMPTRANLNTEEAAYYLGIGKSDLDLSRVTGTLRGLTPPVFVRIGRSVRYRLKDLNCWLDSLQGFSTNAQAEA